MFNGGKWSGTVYTTCARHFKSNDYNYYLRRRGGTGSNTGTRNKDDGLKGHRFVD
jgi:hypothetical protein